MIAIAYIESILIYSSATRDYIPAAVLSGAAQEARYQRRGQRASSEIFKLQLDSYHDDPEDWLSLILAGPPCQCLGLGDHIQVSDSDSDWPGPALRLAACPTPSGPDSRARPSRPGPLAQPSW